MNYCGNCGNKLDDSSIKFCPKSGTKVDSNNSNNATQSNNTTQKSGIGCGAVAAIVFSLLVIFYCIGRFALSNGLYSDLFSDSTYNSNSGEKCYITLAEFNQIQSGMSYDEVKKIVGCEGTVNSDTEIMGSKMTIYSWYGKDGISNANVNISDGKLVNKTQIGLR